MKKILFPLTVCAVALAMSSCTGYDDKQYEEMIPYGPTQEGTFVPGKTVDLKALYGYEGTWTSPDPFVATVDENGVVTAKHVGDIYIQANDQDNLYYHIVVKPTEVIYDVPAVNFGMDLNAVKDAYGDPVNTVVVDDSGNIVSTNDEGAFIINTYNLDPENVFGVEEIVYAPQIVVAFKMTEVVNEEDPAEGEETNPEEGELPDNVIARSDDELQKEYTYEVVEYAMIVNNSCAHVNTMGTLMLKEYYQVFEGTNLTDLLLYNAYTKDTATLGIACSALSTDYIVRYFMPKAETTVLTSTNLSEALGEGEPQ